MRNAKPIALAALALVITAPTAFAQRSDGSAFGSASGAIVNNTRALENNQPNTNANQEGRAQLTQASAPQNAQSAPGRLNEADRNFLSDTARGAIFELQAAQLATEKAQNKQVQQYASMIVNDHAEMNQALQQLARENGMTLPTEMSNQDQDRYRRLENQSGAAFDKAFVADMRQVNTQDTKQEQKEADSSHSQSIKQFIERFKQTDQKHAEEAKKLPQNS